MRIRALGHPTLALLTFLPLLHGATEWKPIEPELLQLKTAKIDPKADAEAIFWDAYVDDTPQGNYAMHRVQNYVRMKLYNQRAVDKYGNVEIPYFPEIRMSLVDIRARTIKTDGSIVELKNNQIFDTVAAKVGRSRLKVKKLALPALEEGAIIEYQWTEVYTEYLPTYMKLVMQREVPTWRVTYFVKPLVHPGFSSVMRYYPFNCKPPAWKPVERDQRYREFVATSLQDVPALREEPRMPSRDDAQAWILLYYTQTEAVKPTKYWPSLGRQLYDEFKKEVKVNGDVKQIAAQVTANEKEVFGKAAALCRWVQVNIRNVAYQTEGLTNEMREAFYKKKEGNLHSGETLKNKIGTSGDILALYFALAQAAGLEPVLIRAGSSRAASFRIDFLDRYLLPNVLIGFKNGEQYYTFNPAVPYLPAGMADYDEHSQPALFADSKDAKLLQMPASVPEESVLARKAKLKLTAEGSLSGHVSMDYGGYFSVAEKRDLDNYSEGERNESVRKDLENRYPGAQITNLKVQNANTVEGNYHVEFDLSMDTYAQRTGKRLFFQPGFFQYRNAALFSDSERKNAIAFQHSYIERDEVVIDFPEDMALESPDMPGQLSLGEVGDYKHNAAIASGGKQLIAKRELVWGRKGSNYFAREAYPTLKRAFDTMHQSDTHTLTLRAK